MRRTIRIVAVERTRIVETRSASCPICSSHRGFLTLAQAVSLEFVSESILKRRLSQGTVHGLEAPNGEFWICRESLLLEAQKPD